MEPCHEAWLQGRVTDRNIGPPCALRNVIMHNSVFAIAPNHQACVAHLHEAGFQSDEISLLAAGTQRVAIADAGEDTAWLPVVGTIRAYGPLAKLLHGDQSLISRLFDLGVPAYAALRFEDALARGAAVVAVHTANGYEIDLVAALLRDGGCDHVAAA